MRKWQNSVILQSAWELHEKEVFRGGVGVAFVGIGKHNLVKLWQKSPSFSQSESDVQPVRGVELVGSKNMVRFGRQMLKKLWQYCPLGHSAFVLHVGTLGRDVVVAVAGTWELSRHVPKNTWQDWFWRQSWSVLHEGAVLVCPVTLNLLFCVGLMKHTLKKLWHTSRFAQSLSSWHLRFFLRGLFDDVVRHSRVFWQFVLSLRSCNTILIWQHKRRFLYTLSSH